VTAGLCPIIDVSFIGSTQAAAKRNQGYTVVSAGNITLAYSKEPTGLPVQDTKLSIGEPCVDPNQKPRIDVESKPVFIGDVDFFMYSCDTYSLSREGEKLFSDGRYQKTGL
jgi:hypothetical protein